MADTWNGSWGTSWAASWNSPITGTGTLTCQSAVLAGIALGASIGTGALSGQASTLSGSGLTQWAAIGILGSSAASMAGTGEVTGEGNPVSERSRFFRFDYEYITYRR